MSFETALSVLGPLGWRSLLGGAPGVPPCRRRVRVLIFYKKMITNEISDPASSPAAARAGPGGIRSMAVGHFGAAPPSSTRQ